MQLIHKVDLNSLLDEKIRLTHNDINVHIFEITVPDFIDNPENLNITMNIVDLWGNYVRINNEGLESRKVRFRLTEFFKSVGTRTCEVVFSKDNKVYHAQKFKYHVDKNLDDDCSIVETEQYPILLELLDKVKKQLDETGALNSEVKDLIENIDIPEIDLTEINESISKLEKNKADKVHKHSANDITEVVNKRFLTDAERNEITKVKSKIDKTSITSDLSGTSETLVLSQKAGAELKKSVSNGKELVANAVTQKGVATNKNDSFTKIASNINNIKIGDYAIGDVILFRNTDIAKQEELRGVWSFSGHSGIINSVAVGNDGFVYSGSEDRTVKKISPEGKEVWSFTGHSDCINTVAVGNDGFVYSGSLDNTVKKISPDGKEVWSFEGHTNGIRSVAVDNQGFVYSCGYDKMVKKISPEGKEVWSFSGHSGLINSVAVGNDGFVYSASNDKTVKKISPEGKEVWSFTGHTNRVNSVAVDNQGFVYSCGRDETVKKISADGKEVWSFTGHSDWINTVAVGNDGFVYSGSDDETVKKITNKGETYGYKILG